MTKRPLEFLAILYIITWTVSPPLQIGTVFRLLALGCAVYLALKNGFMMRRVHIVLLIFILAVAALAYAKSGKVSDMLSQIGIYMLFIGALMNYWYEDAWEDFAMLIPITLLILTVWNFITAVNIMTDASVARLVVRDSDVSRNLLAKGIGGYGLLYTQVIILPALAMWVWNQRIYNKMYFLCGIGWAISFFLFLFNAGYAIAVAAAGIGLFLLAFYRRHSVAPALIISLLLTVAAVYLIGYNETFRNFLLDVFEGTKIARKIADITSSVTTGETANSIATRIARYQSSLNTIMQYPVIGSWTKGDIGSHSALIDSLAQYGIVGGGAYFYMVYCTPLIWKRKSVSPRTLCVLNATIVSITFVALLDTIPYNFTMLLTVLFPIILNDIESRSRIYEDTVDGESDSDTSGEDT